MKTEFFAVLAAVLAASVSAADLPVSRAALAREGQLVREGAKMVVTPLVRDGKPHERVEFSAGERTLVVSGNVGTFPHNYTTHFGRLSLLVHGKLAAELFLLAHDEWNAKDETPGQRLQVDREKGTATWSRPYRLADGTERTLSYVVSALPDGRVAVDYDFGLSIDEARREGTLPIFCRLCIAEREEGSVEYGFGGKVHELYPAEAIIKEGGRQKNWGHGTIGSARFDYELRDEAKHWYIDFPRDELMRAYCWVDSLGSIKDGRRHRGSMVYAGRAIADFKKKELGNGVKGRFVWNLGMTRISESTPPPPVGGIDFWALDALHVPTPPTRNLVMNGSFEQDFKGWRWEDWGGEYTKTEVPREEIVEGGRFGRRALLLRTTQMRCPALCSAPMPLEAGSTYTVSCWAKAANGKKADLQFRVRSVTTGAKYWQFKGANEFPVVKVEGSEWRRASFSFVADAGGFYVQLAPGYGAGRDGVLVDGIQVEKAAEPSEFAEAPFVANLLTSNPYNDLVPGAPIGARLDVQALAGWKGGVKVTVKNGYSEEVFTKKFRIDGDAVLPLDLDPRALGKGLFVVRMEFAAKREGETLRWTDYTRFIIQKPLAGKHPTAQFYANHTWYDRVSLAPHYARKFVEWGWGSTDGRRNYLTQKAAIAPLAVKELGIRNYVHPVAYERDILAAVATNMPSGGVLEGGYDFRKWNEVTPRRLEFLEEAAYRAAMECSPDDDIWTFWNEEEGWARSVGYGEHFKCVEACMNGVKRAFAERGLSAPRFCESHGTSHYFNGRNYDAIDGYLKAALDQGFRYDVVTVHPYSNIDGGTLGSHDADAETQHLISQMKSYGYPDSTPIMFTECFNMQAWRFPAWHCDGWGDSYRCNTTPSHDLGNREFVMAASQMRLYIIALKYWPKVQLVHPWNQNPVVDLRFTPLLFTFSANTLGHFLPNPKFVGDAQPYGDVRGYCFQQGARAVMPIWTTNHDVENGERKGPVLEMELPEDTVFADMFGNRREPSGVVRGNDGFKTVKVPLTPAPLFLVSHDADGLLKGLREAVADDPSTAILVDVRPAAKGALNLTLENLTKAPRSGVVKVDGREMPYKLASRGKDSYKISDGGTDFMSLKSWSGSISPLLPKPWITKWFFVPKCGERPDWEQVPAMPLETVKGEAAKGFRASCKYAWNEKFLFVRIEAEDPQFIARSEDGKQFSPTALYAHDGCLEVYFDGFGDARSQGTRGYDENDSRYDFLEDRVHRFKAVNWQLAQGTASATDEEIKDKLVRKFTRTERGYVYEIAFAARYMAPVDLKPGTVAGTGLCLHEYWRDADGKVRHASVSDATLPGFDCDQKPFVWPLMILGGTK